jgi:hypothetical protein
VTDSAGYRPLHPVLFINPRSGGGKAQRYDLVGRCRARGIGPIVMQGDDDLASLAAAAVSSGADVIRMAEQVQLQAIAVSVKPEGRIERLEVGGDIRTSGDGVVSLELLGTVDYLNVAGRVAAEGRHSDAAHVRRAVVAALEGVALCAPHGHRLVEVD